MPFAPNIVHPPYAGCMLKWWHSAGSQQRVTPKNCGSRAPEKAKRIKYLPSRLRPSHKTPHRRGETNPCSVSTKNTSSGGLWYLYKNYILSHYFHNVHKETGIVDANKPKTKHYTDHVCDDITSYRQRVHFVSLHSHFPIPLLPRPVL